MKKTHNKYLILLILISILPLWTKAQTNTKRKRQIVVLFDNSGSMGRLDVNSGQMSQCQAANYALQILAATVDPEKDDLIVVPTLNSSSGQTWKIVKNPTVDEISKNDIFWCHDAIFRQSIDSALTIIERIKQTDKENKLIIIGDGEWFTPEENHHNPPPNTSESDLPARFKSLPKTLDIIYVNTAELNSNDNGFNNKVIAQQLSGIISKRETESDATKLLEVINQITAETLNIPEIKEQKANGNQLQISCSVPLSNIYLLLQSESGSDEELEIPKTVAPNNGDLDITKTYIKTPSDALSGYFFIIKSKGSNEIKADNITFNFNKDISSYKIIPFKRANIDIQGYIKHNNRNGTSFRICDSIKQFDFCLVDNFKDKDAKDLTELTDVRLTITNNNDSQVVYTGKYKKNNVINGKDKGLGIFGSLPMSPLGADTQESTHEYRAIIEIRDEYKKEFRFTITQEYCTESSFKDSKDINLVFTHHLSRDSSFEEKIDFPTVQYKDNNGKLISRTNTDTHFNIKKGDTNRYIFSRSTNGKNILIHYSPPPTQGNKYLSCLSIPQTKTYTLEFENKFAKKNITYTVTIKQEDDPFWLRCQASLIRLLLLLLLLIYFIKVFRKKRFVKTRKLKAVMWKFKSYKACARNEQGAQTEALAAKGISRLFKLFNPFGRENKRVFNRALHCYACTGKKIEISRKSIKALLQSYDIDQYKAGNSYPIKSITNAKTVFMMPDEFLCLTSKNDKKKVICYKYRVN